MPTDVISKIGTTNTPTTMDYSTLQAWEDACPANLVTADQRWIGECYDQGTFTAGLTVGGQTTDSTRYVYLRCASGASFADKAGVRTNPLAYNASGGVAISLTANYGIGIDGNVSYTRFEKLQIKHTGNNCIVLRQYGSGVVGIVIDRCIVDFSAAGNAPTGISDFTGGGSAQLTIKNCLIVGNTANTAGVGIRVADNSSIYGCTLVVPGGTPRSTGIQCQYAVFTVQNNAILNWSTSFTNNGTIGADGHNASTTASAPGSTGNVTSLTFSSQVVDISTDFRALSTGGLGAGTPDATNLPTDISGLTRSATTPYIGAWEVDAVLPTAFQAGAFQSDSFQIWGSPPSGAQTQSLSATSTATGSLTKAVSNAKADTATNTATLAKAVTPGNKTGTATASGAFTKQAANAKADTETASGSTITKAAAQAKADTETATATLAKACANAKADTDTATATLAKAVSQAKADTETASGSLTSFRQQLQSLSDTETATATLAKAAANAKADTSTASGATVTKAVTQAKADTDTATATLAKAITPANKTGTETASGQLTNSKNAAKSLADTETATATLTKAAANAKADTDTASGNLTTARTFNRSLSDTETATATLSKAAANSKVDTETATATLARACANAKASTDTATATLAKAASKARSGTETASGQMTTTQVLTQSLSNTETATGALTRSSSLTKTDTETASGANVVKAVTQAKADTDTASGSLSRAKNLGITLSDTETASGSLTRSRAQVETGTANNTATLSRSLTQAKADTDTASAALAKSSSTNRSGGTSSASGAITRSTNPVYLGTLLGDSAILDQQVAKELAATATASGVFTHTNPNGTPQAISGPESSWRGFGTGISAAL
jgi:hypothetical protein